jgi:photosystem II stability/assembly factor-like uncharacterized protein
VTLALAALLMSATLLMRQVAAADLPQSVGATHAIEDAMRHDAALAAVCFVNRTTGWAVGDRGVIWHTHDGGASWSQQQSGVRCRLNAVCFLDGRRGWAVGGENLPYGEATRGVVLRTGDGGATWTSVPALVLPLLTGVKFFDPNVGIAYGIGSAAQPSGLFTTRDGGVTWQTVAADHAGAWLAGDFITVDAGAVAGSGGRLATLARNRVVHSPLASSSLRSFHTMRLAAPTGGWIVGDGGLVMSTSDLGRSWQAPPGDLPGTAEQAFDFHALAVQGSHVWVAGSPGTRVFHSADDGASWQAFATPQYAPIRALAFCDAQHGWAVGELGSILATRDGGRTWQVQRAGGRRAALLAVFANAADVPLEMIAQHGAAESYLTAVDLLDTPAADGVAGGVETSLRAREAMLLAGAAAADTAWRFPLPAEDLAFEADDLPGALDRTSDGQGLLQLERHLVRQLRMWRPDVVVTHHASPDMTTRMVSVRDQEGVFDTASNTPAAALIEQLVIRSVEAAADPVRFVELTLELGLEPWQVKKVFGELPPGARGDVPLEPTRFSAWLGGTPRDWSSHSRRLIFAEHAQPPDEIELKLLSTRIAETSGRAAVFSGIPLAFGSDARRPAPALTENIQDIEDMRRMAARRKLLRELLERTEGNAMWVGQVDTLIDGLDAHTGGELLFQLAEGYRMAGRLDLAADTYFLLARRFPEHPLINRALKWLVHFYASCEMAHRVVVNRPTSVRNADPEELASAQSIAGGDVRQASAVVPLAAATANPAVGLSRDDRLRRAVQLAEYLRTARPILYAEPAVRFAEVTAQRQLGFSNEAKRYFLTLGQLPDTDPWRRCAATEQWLATPAEAPPAKRLSACRRTTVRPRLDGHLDEPLWEAAEVLRLRGEAGQTAESAGGQVQLAYDNEFLYLAASCPKASGVDYQPDDRPRSRDADLIEHDRVVLALDIDRDYTTAFELTVDHRGWCHDASWGDATWNPTWYIAAAGDEAAWHVEGAIPLAELTDEPPAAKHVWAVSARRTIPRVGYESWAGDATTADGSPERFGLVIFE